MSIKYIHSVFKLFFYWSPPACAQIAKSKFKKISIFSFQGVTDSYCYIGNHGTCFPLHTEDMDLGAVNYLHWGMPKIWYIVVGDDAKLMEKKIVEALSAQIENQCDNIFRHKDYIVTREFLSANNINYTVLHQNAGEFIVTFPRAYHQGFNLGPNFAEATNFATADWVKFGREGIQCTCGRVEPIFEMDLFKDIKPK